MSQFDTSSIGNGGSNPNSLAPPTYLDSDNIAFDLDRSETVPVSRGCLYRKPMLGILGWLFPDRNGFNVVVKDFTDDANPDFKVLEILSRPGGSSCAYNFAMVLSKGPGKSWGEIEDQCMSIARPWRMKANKLMVLSKLAPRSGFTSTKIATFAR